MTRHLILAGISGSGKSTVGRRVAELLGFSFADIDELIISAAGTPVAEIFRDRGEDHFRLLERTAVARALAAPPQVIAPGAGWMAAPGNLEAVAGERALVVYLRISAELAAARLTGDDTRPLLAGADRVRRLGEQLRAREPWYRKAERQVDASGTVEEVAERVARMLRDG